MGRILSLIDSEIARLTQARALLAGIATAKGKPTTVARTQRKRRTLSTEARKRIADAQKKRWAAFKKQSTK